MKNLTKTILAVAGLSLSVACAPAFKGEGVKKPNLQRQMKAESKLLKAEAESLPNIKSISLGEADEDEILVKIELANVGDDLDQKQLVIDGIVTMNDGVLAAQDAIVGKTHTYKINLACLENCTAVAGILDIEANKAEVAEAKEETKVEAKEEAKEETKDESKDESDETLFTQAGTTAPEVKPTLVSNNNPRTGIIVSSTGEVIHQQTLNTADSLEQNLQDMWNFVGKKKQLNMIK